jgi:N utilization substance protein B
MSGSPTQSPRDQKRQMKSAARLYAVQALFQMEASGQTLDAVRQEFETHRFGAVYEGEEMAEGDPDLFRKTLEDALNWQAKIDQMTDRALVAKWPIDRIDPTLGRCSGRPGRNWSRGGAAQGRHHRICRRGPRLLPEGREPKFVNAVLAWHARRSPRRSRFLFQRLLDGPGWCAPRGVPSTPACRSVPGSGPRRAARGRRSRSRNSRRRKAAAVRELRAARDRAVRRMLVPVASGVAQPPRRVVR